MTCRRTSVRAAAVLMILVMNVFRGHSLTCRPLEYQIGTECCPMCLPGFRVDTYCTEYRSTSCLRCTEGTFMNHPADLPQCYTCASCDAASGLKLKTSCTATSDAVCEPLEGFYCMDSAEEGCKAAEKHSSCQPGQYISQRGTALRDTECSDCSEGTYSDGTFPSCQPHTQCESEHRQLIKAGTVSTDAECGEQSSVSTGLVVGVIVPVCLIAAAAAAAVAWWRIRKRKSSEVHRNELSPELPVQNCWSAVDHHLTHMLCCHCVTAPGSSSSRSLRRKVSVRVFL